MKQYQGKTGTITNGTETLRVTLRYVANDGNAADLTILSGGRETKAGGFDLTGYTFTPEKPPRQPFKDGDSIIRPGYLPILFLGGKWKQVTWMSDGSLQPETDDNALRILARGSAELMRDGQYVNKNEYL